MLKLRVGVPPLFWDLSSRDSNGRVWNAVLRRLARTASLRRQQPGPGHAPVDVWLWSGHTGRLPVREPAVALVSEARWVDPELRSALDPGFMAHIARSTEEGVRCAARVITPSSVATRQIAEGYGVPPDIISTVPHGVDRALFNPRRRRPSRMLAVAGVHGPYILGVGTMFPHKNLGLLRQAAAGLARRSHPHALVLVTAPSPDRDDSSDLEAELTAPAVDGRVVLLHAIPDRMLAGLMAGADVFCLPSTFEGFGLPALEAMASGVPVVVSSGGALPEVVGDAGVIVDLALDDLETVLHELLTDEARRRRLGELALLRAGELSWERTAAGWLDTLTAAASSGR